jgi:hypothetical protein
MSNLSLDPTSTASWQSLVLEAQTASHIELNEDLQSYLVFLLMRFLNEVDLDQKPLALDFLETFHLQGRHQQDHLREVGDKCLLVSGFFPGLAERRFVQINYFIHLGQGAYSALSTLSDKKYAPLFLQLSRGFVPLMDILLTIREMASDKPLLSPIAAAELYAQTGSRAARRDLKRFTVQPHQGRNRT